MRILWTMRLTKKPIYYIFMRIQIWTEMIFDQNPHDELHSINPVSLSQQLRCVSYPQALLQALAGRWGMPHPPLTSSTLIQPYRAPSGWNLDQKNLVYKTPALPCSLFNAASFLAVGNTSVKSNEFLMRSDLSLYTQSKPVCTDLSGGFFYFNSKKADYSTSRFAGSYLLLAVCPTYVVF